MITLRKTIRSWPSKGLGSLALTAGFLFGLAATTQAGLIADWSGNGTTADSSGNGHDGVLMNGAGYAAGLGGSQAFSFDGSDQNVSVPASPSFGFGADPFSINVWAKFDGIRQGGFGSLPTFSSVKTRGVALRISGSSLQTATGTSSFTSMALAARLLWGRP